MRRGGPSVPFWDDSTLAGYLCCVSSKRVLLALRWPSTSMHPRYPPEELQSSDSDSKFCGVARRQKPNQSNESYSYTQDQFTKGGDGVHSLTCCCWTKMRSCNKRQAPGTNHRQPVRTASCCSSRYRYSVERTVYPEAGESSDTLLFVVFVSFDPTTQDGLHIPSRCGQGGQGGRSQEEDRRREHQYRESAPCRSGFGDVAIGEEV